MLNPFFSPSFLCTVLVEKKVSRQDLIVLYTVIYARHFSVNNAALQVIGLTMKGNEGKYPWDSGYGGIAVSGSNTQLALQVSPSSIQLFNAPLGFLVSGVLKQPDEWSIWPSNPRLDGFLIPFGKLINQDTKMISITQNSAVNIQSAKTVVVG